MILKFNNVGTKDYYDEMLFVATYSYKYRKNPNKRTFKLTNFFIFYIIFIIFCLFLFSIFFYIYKELIYIFLLGSLSSLLIFVFISFINTNKRISYFCRNTDTKIIEFDENIIKYRDNLKSFSIKWVDIKYILINKYSIIFLPINNMLPFISIDIRYLDNIEEVIKKYNKDYLLIKHKQ